MTVIHNTAGINNGLADITIDKNKSMPPQHIQTVILQITNIIHSKQRLYSCYTNTQHTSSIITK